MDKITSGDGGNIRIDQVNDSKQQSPATAVTAAATTKVVANESSESSGGQYEYEWSSVSPMLRSPSEHPQGPDFNPDFGKMNKEFRNKIRSRQHEEWD